MCELYLRAHGENVITFLLLPFSRPRSLRFSRWALERFHCGRSRAAGGRIDEGEWTAITTGDEDFRDLKWRR